MLTLRTSLTAAFGLALAGAAPAFGAAFQLREGDPDWLANAFAGIAAKAYDAGTAWNNPAGMTRIDGDEIDSGLIYFAPGIRFSGEDFVDGKPVPGDNGGNGTPPVASAGTEAVWSVSPDLKFGAALESPFGLRTDYPNSWVGRYQALTSAITNLQLGLSVAYRLTPQLSIGGGPIVSYLRARLTQAINVTAFVPDSSDPLADIHGDAFAVGYQLSALYEVSSALRFGIDYKSRQSFNVTGEQRLYVPTPIRVQAPFVATVLDALNSDVAAQVTLPDVLTMSGYYDISPDWALLATVQWTHWSLIQSLNVQTATAVESTPIGFNSTWMESIGANWRLPMFPKLMLQAGLLYDEGANTDATRGPRLPDEARIGPTVGFSYALTPATNVRVAYLHEFPGGGGSLADYTNHFPSAGTLVGSFNNDADVVSAGVTMRF